eukprot:COSAG01_NODE_42071_length_444_cov_0.362319_1_plen_106_part_01
MWHPPAIVKSLGSAACAAQRLRWPAAVAAATLGAPLSGHAPRGVAAGGLQGVARAQVGSLGPRWSVGLVSRAAIWEMGVGAYFYCTWSRLQPIKRYFRSGTMATTY